MMATPKNEDISAINIAHRGATWDLPNHTHLSTPVSVTMTQKWQSCYSASSVSGKAAGNLSLLRLAGYHWFSAGISG